MKFRIATDHVVEATSVEDALRQFATVLMQAARHHSEDPKEQLTVEAPNGSKLSVRPVKES